jgi:hypothetical protein
MTTTQGRRTATGRKGICRDPRTPTQGRHAASWRRGTRRHIRALREQRDVAKEKLAHDTKVFVDRCVAAEIPVRDIAFLTGLTPQRISQISRS